MGMVVAKQSMNKNDVGLRKILILDRPSDTWLVRSVRYVSRGFREVLGDW